jgi:hypothetical protein
VHEENAALRLETLPLAHTNHYQSRSSSMSPLQSDLDNLPSFTEQDDRPDRSLIFTNFQDTEEMTVSPSKKDEPLNCYRQRPLSVSGLPDHETPEKMSLTEKSDPVITMSADQREILQQTDTLAREIQPKTEFLPFDDNDEGMVRQKIKIFSSIDQIDFLCVLVAG